ncbi:unnamed protein product [Paramecium octaurelia]|uniref:Uncharacterized protein n=1 Tax=Paramecium octaurelia TaxID=43137 RepID=A0A8S1TLG7_PAROT|nr:unnamed protein product [Paramecium octaurelia]
MHTLRTSLLLCMLIYINYAGSEALSLLNQMQPKFKEESDLGSEDLIYKKVTEQLKQQKPYLQIDEEDTKNEVSFREFYKSVRSGKHEIVEDEEEINIVEPEHKEIEIQSYLQELSDGLEPQTESIVETELQTDPEKLGKFKKYFIKEEEPKLEVNVETKIENNQPIEKKMTLREKLEMKKKQAQQPPVVAAIQIKQEVNTQEQVTNPSDQNVGKTTLMKKIEEFKKQKQSKETQESQQPKEEIVQEQNIKPVHENPLRKLLNKKAEEKKEKEVQQQVEKSVEEKQDALLGLTQEVELESKYVEIEDQIDGQENKNVVEEKESSHFDQDPSQSQGESNLEEIDQEHDESHQEYITSDDNNYINDENIQQQQQSEQKEEEQQQQQEQKLQQEDVQQQEQQEQQDVQQESEQQIDSKTQINNESLSFNSDSSDNIVQEEDQNQQEIQNDDQINPSVENLEQEVNNNNQQEQDSQLTQTVDNQEQNENQINQDILQDNQQQQQFELEQPYDEQQELEDETQNEQQQQSLDEENQDEKLIVDQQTQNTQNEVEKKEILNDDQVENTLSQGFVMENNVETSNYLEEVQEAEKLRKKREVEEIIQEEERIKQELEQKKLEDEMKLNELQEEQQHLIDDKQKEEEQIQQVEKQIELEQSELQDFDSEKDGQLQTQEKDIKKDDIQELQPQQETLQEAPNDQTDNNSQQAVEEQPVILQDKIDSKEIKSDEDLIKSQDETLENGFSIDEYERQQHRNEEKKAEDDPSTYAQSSELFHNSDYTSQIVNDQEDQVIEQSVPTLQINEQQTEGIQYEPQIQISQEVKFDDISNNQVLNNQDQDGQSDQNNITELPITENQSNEEQYISQDQFVEDPTAKEQEQLLSLDNQVEQANEENQISNESSQDSIEVESSNESIEGTQNQVYSQQETLIIESDTPNLIPIDESQSNSYQYEQEADNEDNDVVQFDVYNSSSNVDTQNKESQAVDQINTQQQPIIERVTQQDVEDTSNLLSVNKIHSFSLLQQDMKVDDTIKIEYIDLETKQDQSISKNTLIHHKRQQSSFLQLEETEMDYNEEQFEIFMAQKKQQEQMEKEKKRKKLKAREEKQRKLEEEQYQQQLIQQKQQQEILKQQQQLIELQNQQLLNKQKYKMATKQNNQVILESKPIKGDNFSHLQKQQSQIQLLNQQIDTEFSFQQILSRVEKEQRQGQKQLRSNSKHIKNADLNFFQLTEKQQQNKISLQSQDLFEAIKQEIKECDLNNYTNNLCQLCQSDVVYEINDDNWYLIGIAYGLKRHFQNLLNTVQYHFKNAKIYTSFNKEQQVCLTLGDQFEIENLEEILGYYNNQTLPRNSQFLKIPQKIKANFAQMKVDLNQHKFMNFSLNAAIRNQEHHNGFTVTEQQVKLSQDFDYIQQGSILYPGQSIPYKLNIQSNGIENMQLELNPQIYEKVLENYLAKNYLQQIQVTYRDSLKSNFVVVDNDEVLELEITIQK